MPPSRWIPLHADAYTNLGILLTSLKRTEEAAACYSKAITLRPTHRESRKLLALAHCTLGEFEQARRILEGWLTEDPGDPIARHMLAACTGREVPARASNDYLQQTFDRFAVTFESRLERLSYRAPALVRAALERGGTVPSRQCEVLDAGCGTGLCAPLLAPFARRLTGVDLSAGMLAIARDQQLYDDSVQAELTEFLVSRVQQFDLIVSADALVNRGDLAPVLTAAAEALRPGGRLVFTLEHLADGAAADYRLEWHGRYCHSCEYVAALLTGAGLSSTIEEAELRMEAGKPVAGLVIHARAGADAVRVKPAPVIRPAASFRDSSGRAGRVPA